MKNFWSFFRGWTSSQAGWGCYYLYFFLRVFGLWYSNLDANFNFWGVSCVWVHSSVLSFESVVLVYFIIFCFCVCVCVCVFWFWKGLIF